MDIIKKIKVLDFPLGEYVVIGSGILAVLGLRPARDIDIAVSPVLRDKLRSSGDWKEKIRWGKLFLSQKSVEIVTQLDWDKYPTKVEEAIVSATIIDGIPFLNLEETILFKKALGRKKDLKDISLIDQYLKKSH